MDSESDSNSNNLNDADSMVSSDSLTNNEPVDNISASTHPEQQPEKHPDEPPSSDPDYKPSKHHERNLILATLGSLAAIILLIALPFILASTIFNDEAMSIVNVTATDINDGITAANSSFHIATEHGSIEKVRTAIYVEPAIDYEITEVNPGTLYELTPASDLTDNIILNVDSVKDDVISYKWAFQTKKDLSVSKIYPANGANYVSENSVIEFSFSYPDVDGVENHFSITPQVSGTLEHLDRSWRFTPDSPFAANTTYEVRISAGLSYGEEVMAKDFYSSFSTFANSISSSDAKNAGITIDGVSFFTESEFPAVVFATTNERKYLDDSEYVAVEQVSTADDYIKYLNGERIDTTVVGDLKFNIISDNKTIAILEQTLPTGYYILHFKSNTGQTLHTADIEVNNLSAYVFESERDFLVWTAENGELKSGIKVNFRNKDYETGADGILTIKGASNFSGDIEYLKVGNSDRPLVIATKNFKNDLYPHGFIYTDRPLYAPNDTIKVWGYVPLAFFRDAPNRNNFSITFKDIKKSVTIDSEGFFSTEIKLSNHKDVPYGLISLIYNDATIASRNISIEDYTLENYTYEFIAPKNYVNAGENINFTVKVSHITGFPAINKDIVITYKEHDYYGTTNGQGKVDFSIPTNYETASWDRPSNYSTENISIKSGGVEYNKYSTDITIFIFKNNLIFERTKDDQSVKFMAQSLDLTKNVNISYGFNNLPQANFNGSATLRLKEYCYKRTITGYRYNEYTKENEPVYNTTSYNNIISEVPVSFKDGKLIYDYPTNFKDPEDNVKYSYTASIGTTDSTGRPAYSYETTYYSNNYVGEDNDQLSLNAIGVYDYTPVSNWYYNLYRFGLKDINFTGSYSYRGDQYSLGDELELQLYSPIGGMQNPGKTLAIAYKEDIINSTIFEDQTLSLQFDQSLYPGANIAGAYFTNGKLYRIAPRYYDYDESNSKLNVQVETSKQSYAPGDTVKAKIIVTNPDGSRASGRVNLSVVNEAIFSAGEDDTSILSSIYTNKTFKSYSMSTYYDYELYSSGGLGSTGGYRANFGDTIFFGEKTLNNGEVEFEFDLNDSITSFRLTALAVENGNVINAGVGTQTISSSLPLSISTVMPKKVKNTDDLVLNATSITSSGNTINYTFEIKELDKVLTASAAPGQSVSVNFGKIDLGQYTVIISAEDSAGNTDKMIYPLEIVETAQEISVKKTLELGNDTEITPTRTPIILEIYDKETKQYLTYLDFLESHRTARLDTTIAYYKSLEYKNKYYGETATVHAPNLENYITESGLLKPLENAEGDYVLTALANYYAPDYFDLRASNFGISLDDDSDTVIKKLLVLASFREPVLLDLQTASSQNLSDENKLLLGLAFAFIGDYNAAKFIYGNINISNVRADLFATLATFINKTSASAFINQIIVNDPASDYLPFAIISYFENNEVDLRDASTVTISLSSETEQVEISPLVVVRRVFYDKDLSNLKFNSSSDDNLVTYYYQGKITELGEDFTSDINAYLEGGLNVGQITTLVLDISNITGSARNGELNIALPSSLKFSATFTGDRGLHLTLNNNEYVKLSLNDKYEDNIICIPLYVASAGNYEFEPVVFIENGNYHLSNDFTVDLR